MDSGDLKVRELFSAQRRLVRMMACYPQLRRVFGQFYRRLKLNLKCNCSRSLVSGCFLLLLPVSCIKGPPNAPQAPESWRSKNKASPGAVLARSRATPLAAGGSGVYTLNSLNPTTHPLNNLLGCSLRAPSKPKGQGWILGGSREGCWRFSVEGLGFIGFRV